MPPTTAAAHNMGHLLHHPSVILPPRALITPRLRSAAAAPSPRSAIAAPKPILKRQYSHAREPAKLINKINTSTDGKPQFSFEFFTPKQRQNHPPLTEAFMANAARMTAHGPNFCGMMWRHTDPYPPLTLDLAARIQNRLNIDTLLHLTCANMPLPQLDHALSAARSAGIRNILAIRGDTPSPHTPSDTELPSSLDLVQYIRASHGDHFCIAVAGYPEGHRSGGMTATAEGYEGDLRYLKRKVDAGAEVIITQLFLDAEVFLKFVGDCRRIGILCPVVPGVMPITAYRNFKLMTDTCRIGVPEEVRKAVEAARGDDAALAAYGVDLATGMCRRILESGVRQLHFYTMNREGPTVAVLRNLGLVGGV